MENFYFALNKFRMNNIFNKLSMEMEVITNTYYFESFHSQFHYITNVFILVCNCPLLADGWLRLPLLDEVPEDSAPPHLALLPGGPR